MLAVSLRWGTVVPRIQQGLLPPLRSPPASWIIAVLDHRRPAATGGASLPTLPLVHHGGMVVANVGTDNAIADQSAAAWAHTGAVSSAGRDDRLRHPWDARDHSGP